MAAVLEPRVLVELVQAIYEHHPEPREKNRRRKKRGAALRRYRCCLRQLEVASSLMSHLKIHLSRIPNKGGSHPL
ncbi:uncharacterized protein [Manis javanica]|uniref:uncharacterized protein isoform X8 n=1 Tax=Manis javanica TaxID=9974 RepID=UPI003C6CFBC0